MATAETKFTPGPTPATIIDKILSDATPAEQIAALATIGNRFNGYDDSIADIISDLRYENGLSDCECKGRGFFHGDTGPFPRVEVCSCRDMGGVAR